MKTVLFLGFDKNRGLTYHFVDWMVALRKAAGTRVNMVFATRKNEQHEGLHDRLKQHSSLDCRIVESIEDLDKTGILETVDVVHCHGFGHAASMLEIRKRKKLKYKIIVTIHAFRNLSRYRPIYANLMSYYCNKIDVTHFLSHTAKNEFLRCNLMYNRSNRSFVFPLGCNETEFTGNESIEHLDFYQELAEGKNNIVYLASLYPGKQHLCLIKAIQDVLVKENARLWLFGHKGSTFEKVQRHIERNGLAQYVRVPGQVHREHIPAILKKMDLAVCSSKSENSPHAIMEPMFAGIPVVTFDVGTASYLIRDFSNGFVARNRSERVNFAKAVEFLLHNRESAAAMGRNNHEIAHRWLTWDVHCKNCVDMYLGL